MDKEPEYLSAKEIAGRLGLEHSTFLAMVAKSELPQGIEMTGKKLKMWPTEDVSGMAWMLKVKIRMRKSTPDEEEKDAE